MKRALFESNSFSQLILTSEVMAKSIFKSVVMAGFFRVGEERARFFFRESVVF